MTPIERAHQLLQTGDSRAAVEVLEEAGRRGDADSLFELATWFMRPVGVARDLTRATTCFGLAGKLGHDAAARIHLSLLGVGIGVPRQWQTALALLEARADADDDARRQLSLLNAMAIDVNGDPTTMPEAEQLSESPHVVLFPSLLTSHECSYLIGAATGRMSPAVIVDPASGRTMAHPIRTSESASFGWVNEAPFIHAINRRMAAASGSAVDAGEPLQVLRYRPGQQYRPHHDALPDTDNQRILTMLVYLNDAYSGGETMFLSSGLKVKGAIGDALLFRNADEQGVPDPRAQHAGLPVTSGEKLIASRWIHQRRFGPL